MSNSIRFTLSLVFAIISATGFSQVVLDRQVIAPFAFSGTVTPTMRINATGGQVAFTTISTTENHLTQGFYQPRNVSEPSIEYTVSQDPCSGVFTIEVTGLQNCPTATSLTYLWNGTAGGSLFETVVLPVTLSVETAGCNINTTIDPIAQPVDILPCDLLFYTIITPNGDGVNDAWFIENLYGPYLENEVIIFNRWGSEVWKGKNYDNDAIIWKGNSGDGFPLPDGTYYFTLTTAIQNHSGFVELQR